MSTHETLGLMLVREGIIHRSQLYDALRLQRQNNRLLGTCLLSLGYISAEKLLQILSEQLQVPVLPPGSLKWASEEAVNLVPRELVLRLRIVPYSYDGQMLGVAVADGRILEHLHDVAKRANSAVGAYIALEMEIEAALGKLYGHNEVAGTLSEPAEVLPGRPRPMRVEAAGEVPSRDFGSALGIDEEGGDLGGGEPVVLATPKRPEAPATPPPAAGPALGALPAYSPAVPSVPAASPTAPPPAASPTAPPPVPVGERRPTAPAPGAQPPPPAPRPASASLAAPPPAAAAPPAAAPPPAPAPAPLSQVKIPRGPPTDPPMERLSFFAAVEQIYAAELPQEIGMLVGRAMFNYFERVMILALLGRQLVLLGYGGGDPVRSAIALEAVPEVVAGLGRRSMSYGVAKDDPRGEELCDMFGFDEAPTCFIAPVGGEGEVQLMAYADNGDRDELYEDLHDVELLFKEAETALGMLASK